MAIRMGLVPQKKASKNSESNAPPDWSLKRPVRTLARVRPTPPTHFTNLLTRPPLLQLERLHLLTQRILNRKRTLLVNFRRMPDRTFNIGVVGLNQKRPCVRLGP